MTRNFDDALPAEGHEERPRPSPDEQAQPAQTVWNWEELNAKFRPRLIAAGVVRFGLTQDECEDAAQTVFLKVLAMNPRVRDAKAYLRAAFLNQCLNIIEARDRRRVHESALTEDLTAPAAGRAAERVRTVSAVTSAYGQVDPRCRQVITSYCVDDRTLAETAARSGYSSKTVWKRIQECLKRMRACLGS